MQSGIPTRNAPRTFAAVRPTPRPIASLYYRCLPKAPCARRAKMQPTKHNQNAPQMFEAAALTGPEWPWNARTSRPDATSQSFNVLSPLPDIAVRPSGANVGDVGILA